MSEEKKTYPLARVRIQTQKRVFLESVAKMGIVEIACQKTGISRATFNRWKADDVEFRRQVMDAMNKGSEIMDDVVESKFIQLIQQGEIQAILFYLKYRHHKYNARGAIQKMLMDQADDELIVTEDEQKRIDAALKGIREYQAAEEEKLEIYMASQVASATPSSPQQPSEG